MPPKSSSSSSFEKYFINIICDFSLVSHFEKLKLPTPQKLHQDNEKNENNSKNNDQQQQQQQQQQSKSYLSALCEDVGMERATVYTVTRGSPYLQSSNMMNMMNNTSTTNSTVQQQNQQQQPFEIICVVISLPLESARQLYRNRNLVKFLKDGMEAIQNKYADKSKNDEDSTMIMKAFLVIEVPRNNNNNKQDTNNNLIDHGILSELLIFQSATAGAGVIAGCTFVTVSSTTSTTTTSEVTSYLLALGNYLARKAGMVTSGKETQQQQQQQQQDANNINNNNSTIFAPFTSKIRERDDTFTLFEPQFLTRGKIDTADWAAAYRSFLCEIEGITPQKAVSIISKFPSLKSLLDAISRKDQRALAVLADSVGGGGGGTNNNRRMGDALVQKIIDKMTTKFDEKIALSSNARSFILGGDK